MQGATVTQTGNTADTVTAQMHPESMKKIPAGSGMNKKDLMNIINVRGILNYLHFLAKLWSNALGH